MNRLCYCRLMSDPDILVFSANEEANWWTPSAFSRREGEALRNYDKNLDKNVIVTFKIPEKLVKTKVYTFFKCWKNGYCLNASTKKIPENIINVFCKKE